MAILLTDGTEKFPGVSVVKKQRSSHVEVLSVVKKQRSSHVPPFCVVLEESGIFP